MDKIWNFIKLYGKFLNIRDQIKKKKSEILWDKLHFSYNFLEDLFILKKKKLILIRYNFECNFKLKNANC
jgi:hypothetical protein